MLYAKYDTRPIHVRIWYHVRFFFIRHWIVSFYHLIHSEGITYVYTRYRDTLYLCNVFGVRIQYTEISRGSYDCRVSPRFLLYRYYGRRIYIYIGLPCITNPCMYVGLFTMVYNTSIIIIIIIHMWNKRTKVLSRYCTL